MWPPTRFSTTWPCESRIVNAPACAFAESPRAAAGGATTEKTRNLPLGKISTMLDPVPCWLAALLKLLTSTSPRTRSPRLCGTTATPYGFWSPIAGPLVGTVEATVVIVGSRSMNGRRASASDGDAKAIDETAASSPRVCGFKPDMAVLPLSLERPQETHRRLGTFPGVIA